MNLTDLEKLTTEYAKEREALASVVQDMAADMDKIRHRFLPVIRRKITSVKTAKSILHTAIQESPALFEKPRTVVFSGIKIGIQKQKGKIIIEDEDFTVERIYALFTDLEAQDLLRITAKPNKDTLANVPAHLLKKIGVQVTTDTDAVLIKPTDTDVEKTVAALLADSDPEQEAA